MHRAQLKIASVLVGDSKHTFHARTPDAQDAQTRLALLDDIVKQALAAGCRVVALPAGFFVVASYADRDAIEQECLTRLAGKKLVVAFGIDVKAATKTGNGKGDAAKTPAGKVSDGKYSAGKAAGASAQGQYDFFGYVVEAGQFLISRVAQTGVTTEEVQRQIPAAEYTTRSGASRLLGGAKVALLLCGEVRSKAWHAAMGKLKPDVVLHLAHASVPLGGTSKESWARSVDGLLHSLPETAVWVFADHIRALGHWDSASGWVPLVRGGDDASVSALSDDKVAHDIPAWMYVYEAA